MGLTGIYFAWRQGRLSDSAPLLQSCIPRQSSAVSIPPHLFSSFSIFQVSCSFPFDLKGLLKAVSVLGSLCRSVEGESRPWRACCWQSSLRSSTAETGRVVPCCRMIPRACHEALKTFTHTEQSSRQITAEPGSWSRKD